MKLELNKEEKNVLVQLIDLAVKSGGLQVAKAGSYMADKISQLKEDKPKEEPKETKEEVKEETKEETKKK
jgi:hypothetical protein